ncbi:hypothetical protein [Endozoicomonas arenosclerae]|uniref:hypothetical protein n=1 Tax=Endozoicomonas arenosclerae TaxID=1633495 RepID=UPI0012947510|nr:hypothetical protein [Endozoicomonas arenosclerae]
MEPVFRGWKACRPRQAYVSGRDYNTIILIWKIAQIKVAVGVSLNGFHDEWILLW